MFNLQQGWSINTLKKFQKGFCGQQKKNENFKQFPSEIITLKIQKAVMNQNVSRSGILN